MYRLGRILKKKNCVVVLLSILSIGMAVSAIPVWGPNVTLSLGIKAREPAVAIDTLGRIVAVWSEQVISPAVPQFGIYAASSTDGGVTFSPPLWIGDGTTDQTMTSDSHGVVYAAWQKQEVGAPYSFRVYVTKSSDGGRGWDTPQLVTLRSGLNDRPWLSTGQDGNIYLSYLESSPRVQRVILKAPAGSLDFQRAGSRPQALNKPVSVRADGEMFLISNANDLLTYWHCPSQSRDCTDIDNWNRQVVRNCAGCRPLDLALAQDGEILVAYLQNYPDSTARGFVARSADNGDTFPTVACMTGPTPRTMLARPIPWFIGDSVGGAYFMWAEGTNPGPFQVYSSVWKRGEAEREIITANISSATSTLYRSFPLRVVDDFAQIVFGANSLFAIWVDSWVPPEESGSQKVRFARTTTPLY